MSSNDDSPLARALDEGASLGRTLIASRIVGGTTPPPDTKELLAPVLDAGPEAIHTLVAALIHTADWAAAVLHRHAQNLGMSPEALYQGISLELNANPVHRRNQSEDRL
jgi:hypothetical protein